MQRNFLCVSITKREQPGSGMFPLFFYLWIKKKAYYGFGVTVGASVRVILGGGITGNSITSPMMLT